MIKKQIKSYHTLLVYSAIIFVTLAVTFNLLLFFILNNGLTPQERLIIHAQVTLLLLGVVTITYFIGRVIFLHWVTTPLQVITHKTKTFLDTSTYSDEEVHSRVYEIHDVDQAFAGIAAKYLAYAETVDARVSERTRLLEEGSRLVQEVLDTTPNMLCLMNTEIDAFNYANREFADFFGHTNDQIISNGPAYFRGRIFPADLPIFQNHVTKLLGLEDGQVVQSDFRLANASGDWKWLSMRSIVFQRNLDGQPKLVLYVGQDISDLKETEEKLRFMSIHDQLTGLYNRLYFEEEMSRLERGRNYPISAIMADLDGLKSINDSFGHAQGDELLKAVSGILRSCFRGDDVVARIGGDEFAALLPGASSEAAQRVVKRINEKMEKYSFQFKTYPVGISLGISTIEKGGSLIDALKEADEHMYQNKQDKKNHIDTKQTSINPIMVRSENE